MESLLATALHSKLKYYIKGYTRDQFRLQGKTLSLSKLELNGDVLHAIIGLPSTLRVSVAKVDKLEIKLPGYANIKAEPTVVSICTLDLVLQETGKNEPPVSTTANTPSAKSTSYGLADRIADGMTVEVGTVNLMLETRGGSKVSGHADSSWIPPICNITIKNMLLYTTNQFWEVVGLNETRDFFSALKAIYIFKKLEWESLSIALLPHPDMFNEMAMSAQGGGGGDDGAKRAFFGGEHLIDNVSGNAYVTMHRTEQNNPLGLEVDVKLSEALCPALSEPGLRALMRFMTGMYACLNRADIKSSTQLEAEAAGRTYVSATVDNIFMRIKETEYQLEVALQSLRFIKASVGEGDVVHNMSRLYLGNLFLRDTRSMPPVTLIQPRQADAKASKETIPDFANDVKWPRIYPLPAPREEPKAILVRLYSAHTVPAPAPPALASRVVISCNPLKINVQEEACFRIASLVADGIMVQAGQAAVSDPALKYFLFSLDEFDLSVPVPRSAFPDDLDDDINDNDTPGNGTAASPGGAGGADDRNGAGEDRAGDGAGDGAGAEPGTGVGTGAGTEAGAKPGARAGSGARSRSDESQFTGARLHVRGFGAVQDPLMAFRVLEVHKDAACYAAWDDAGVDASQARFAVWARHLSVSLETGAFDDSRDSEREGDWSAGLWRCAEMVGPRAEALMLTRDGAPLGARLPPPGGVVRLALACERYISNTSRVQLLCVLRIYSYIGRVARALVHVSKGRDDVDPARGLASLAARRNSTPPPPSLAPATAGTAAAGIDPSNSSSLSMGELAALAPSDSALILRLGVLQFRLLESVAGQPGVQGPLLARLLGAGISAKVTHRSFGEAAAITSLVTWQDICIECLETEAQAAAESAPLLLRTPRASTAGAGNAHHAPAAATAAAAAGGGRSADGDAQGGSSAGQEAAAQQAKATESENAAVAGAERSASWNPFDDSTASADDNSAGLESAASPQGNASNEHHLAVVPVQLASAGPVAAGKEEAEADNSWNPFDSGSNPFEELQAAKSAAAIDPAWSNPFETSDADQELSSPGLNRSPNSSSRARGSVNSPPPATAIRSAALKGGEEGQAVAAGPPLESAEASSLRAIVWKGEQQGSMAGTVGARTAGALPFIDVDMTHVIPFGPDGGAHTLTVSAKVGGVRLGGGMGYNEALLHRYGLLAPDGGPGRELLRILELVTEGGAIAELLGQPAVRKASTSTAGASKPDPAATQSQQPQQEGEREGGGGGEQGSSSSQEKKKEQKEKGEGEEEEGAWEVPLPDEVDLDLQLLDWLFALEGAAGVQVEGRQASQVEAHREDRCWHTTFRMLQVLVKSKRIAAEADANAFASAPGESQGAPAQSVTVRLEGIQALKPRMLEEAQKQQQPGDANGQVAPARAAVTSKSGLDIELRLVNQEEPSPDGPASDESEEEAKPPGPAGEWALKSVQMAVQEPMEVEATKGQMDHLVDLCRSEVAAASRIAAGGLKLLRQQGHSIVTQSTIDQLIDYGTKVVTGIESVSEGDLKLNLGQPGWRQSMGEAGAAVAASQRLCRELTEQLGRTAGDAREGGAGATPEREGGDESTASAEVTGRVAELAGQLARVEELLAKMKHA